MKGKKLLAGLVSAAMMIGSAAIPVFAEDENVVEIGTAADLVAFEEQSQKDNFTGKTVKLTDDIDMSTVTEWTPIGRSKMFAGTFDGDGHTISNFKLINSGNNGYGNGLFGNLAPKSKVKNLTMDSAYVAGYQGYYWGNVYGIVAGYAYGTVELENIHVKNSEIWGFGKVAAILGMAADPNGVTTMKDCSVENTTIYATYDVAPFIGLTQNDVAFENNTSSGVEWIPSKKDKYVSINDETVYTNKDGSTEVIKVNGLFWLYGGKELYNGYADYYTDFKFGYEEYQLKYNPNYYAVDGLMHNEYEASIGGEKYDLMADAVAAAKAGDVIEGKYFAPNADDLSYLAPGLAGIVDGNNCTVKDISETLNNGNATDDEKIEIINSTDFSKQDDDIVNSAVDVIKSLPVGVKENISAAKVSEITDKTADAKIAVDDETNTTITAKSIASGVETLEVTKLDESQNLQQPESVNALYFDITLKDAQDNEIKEVDVPVFITIKVENSSIVKKVIRHHDGVTSEMPFEVVDDSHIGLSIAKFSDFAVILGQDIPAENAILYFEETTAAEDCTAKYNLYFGASDYNIIRDFKSGEFAFSMTGTSSAEFTAADHLEIVYEPVAGKYRINRTADGVNASLGISMGRNGAYTKLGTLTITGVGSGSFDISDIKMYKKSKEDSLAVEVVTVPAATMNYNIEPAKANLTVNVDFPNAINNNVTSYQDMSVNVKGVDFDETYSLGNDAASVVNFADSKYTLTIEDKLQKNTAYTVTVSGAGYRTTRYTVTMTDNKVLNFWNNVKDNAVNVEEGKDTSAKNVTFLAGDIVKDNTINIYDLSAVVSYFGTQTVTSAASDYAKYDLNRDGKIDSKDVAYVLVSWGK